MSKETVKRQATRKQSEDYEELKALIKSKKARDIMFLEDGETQIDDIEDIDFIITPHYITVESSEFTCAIRKYKTMKLKVYFREEDELSPESLGKYNIMKVIKVRQREVEYHYESRIKPNKIMEEYEIFLRETFPSENYFSQEAEDFVSKFRDYIKFLFQNIFKNDYNDPQRVLFLNSFINEICSIKYRKIFLKCVVSESISEDANWELFENIGDKKLLSLFNDYITMKFSNITPEIVTNMLQYYMSKVAQAEVCQLIGLSKFIAVDRDIRIGDKEDVFEAFFAVLDNIQKEITQNPKYTDFGCEDLTQFYIMFPPNFILERVFNWIYGNIELDLNRGKPAKTILIEIGYLFNVEGRRDGFKLVKGESFCTTSITDECATRLSEVVNVNKEKILETCTTISPYRASNNQDFKQLQKDTQYYLNENILNSLFQLGLTQDILNNARNLRNLQKWPPADMARFTSYMRNIPYVLQYRNVTSEPNSTDIYWKLEFDYKNRKHVFITKHIALEKQYDRILQYLSGILV